MAAAYLDFRDTTELKAAIARGDAPPPSCMRGSGRRREPIWARIDLDRVASCVPTGQAMAWDVDTEDLTALV